MWFNINGDWIGEATKTTSGWGYVRADLPTTDGRQAAPTSCLAASPVHLWDLVCGPNAAKQMLAA
jgi:hypothetical protein